MWARPARRRTRCSPGGLHHLPAPAASLCSLSNSARSLACCRETPPPWTWRAATPTSACCSTRSCGGRSLGPPTGPASTWRSVTSGGTAACLPARQPAYLPACPPAFPPARRLLACQGPAPSVPLPVAASLHWLSVFTPSQQEMDSEDGPPPCPPRCMHAACSTQHAQHCPPSRLPARLPSACRAEDKRRGRQPALPSAHPCHSQRGGGVGGGAAAAAHRQHPQGSR